MSIIFIHIYIHTLRTEVVKLQTKLYGLAGDRSDLAGELTALRLKRVAQRTSALQDNDEVLLIILVLTYTLQVCS